MLAVVRKEQGYCEKSEVVGICTTTLQVKMLMGRFLD
jgi:hypothetical protein